VFGISKQAFYKRIKTANIKAQNDQIILDCVRKIRMIHPRAGTRKLIQYLQHDLNKVNIKTGRDALFTLLRNNGLLVKNTKTFMSLPIQNIISINLLTY
jgi:putative transposase